MTTATLTDRDRIAIYLARCKRSLAATNARLGKEWPFMLKVLRTRSGTELHIGTTVGGKTYCGCRAVSETDPEKITAHASACDRCFPTLASLLEWEARDATVIAE